MLPCFSVENGPNCMLGNSEFLCSFSLGFFSLSNLPNLVFGKNRTSVFFPSHNEHFWPHETVYPGTLEVFRGRNVLKVFRKIIRLYSVKMIDGHSRRPVTNKSLSNEAMDCHESLSSFSFWPKAELDSHVAIRQNRRKYFTRNLHADPRSYPHNSSGAGYGIVWELFKRFPDFNWTRCYNWFSHCVTRLIRVGLWRGRDWCSNTGSDRLEFYLNFGANTRRT